jgi:tyrosyl-tRNA synthetase
VALPRIEAGIPAFQLFAEIGLCLSKGAARRLIEQGGAYVNEERIRDFDALIGSDHLTADGILLKAGKKRVHRIRVQG